MTKRTASDVRKQKHSSREGGMRGERKGERWVDVVEDEEVKVGSNLCGLRFLFDNAKPELPLREWSICQYQDANVMMGIKYEAKDGEWFQARARLTAGDIRMTSTDTLARSFPELILVGSFDRNRLTHASWRQTHHQT
ncbi:hypothetical protein BBP40_007389 [Aspergillus hancockii]|nr:hypothetical protein BBP40_007389 [Aspergillus hancockii]